MQEPDPALVQRARAGDDAAFDEIVRILRDPVVRFVDHLVRDRALAEDVTQEAFVRCHRNLHRYESQGRFTTWLVQIARNAGIDAIRARDRHARVWQRVPPPAPAADPQIRAEIRAALGDLPAKLREPLLLIEITGFTYAEASEVLGIAEGTVKSRVFRARRELAEWFASGDDHAV